MPTDQPRQVRRIKALRDIVLIVAALVAGYFGLQAFLVHNAREDSFKECRARGHSEARCTCVVDAASKAATLPVEQRQKMLADNVEQCRPL